MPAAPGEGTGIAGAAGGAAWTTGAAAGIGPGGALGGKVKGILPGPVGWKVGFGAALGGETYCGRAGIAAGARAEAAGAGAMLRPGGT